MSEGLHEQIARLVLEQIDAGIIDVEQVRQIVVGLSGDCQSINIWQSEVWEKYASHDDEQAIAAIDNRDWLAQLDQIGRSADVAHESFIPYMPNLGFEFSSQICQHQFLNLLSIKINEIREALKLIAQEQLLGEFSCLVGLMGQRVSGSDDADLICVYHPQGVNLLPVNDRPLPGYDSYYGHASLVDDGIIVFYTEEEDVDEEFRHYQFADMEFFTLDDDEVVFQLANGLQIELGAGHTHEEWNGLGRQEVERLLAAHFRHHIGAREFNIKSVPMDQSAAWNHWCTIAKTFFRKQLTTAVRECLKTGGVAQAKTFLSKMELTPEESIKVKVSYFPYYLSQEYYDELIQGFLSCDENQVDYYEWGCFYRALIMQDNWQAVFDHSKRQLTPKLDNFASILHLSYYVIAGVHLAYQEDFASQLAAVTKSNYQKTPFYIARLLVGSDNHIDDLSKLMQDSQYTLAYAEKDFLPGSELLVQVRGYLELQRNAYALDEQLAPLFTELAEKPAPLDFENIFAERWVANDVVMLQQQSETAFKHEIRKGFFIDQQHWVALQTGFAQLQVTGSECQQLHVYRSDKRYSALEKCGNTIYALAQQTVEIFTLTGEEPALVSETLLILDQPDCISVSNNMAAITDGKKLALLDVSNPLSPQYVSCISLTETLDRYVRCNCLLLKDHWLYLGFDNQGVAIIDVKNPLLPKMTGFIACNRSFDIMDAEKDLLVVANKDGVIAINIASPNHPQLIDDLSLRVDYLYQVAPMSFIGGGNTSWCGVRFELSAQKLVLDIWPLFESHYSQKAIVPNQNGFFLCDDNAIDLQFYSEAALQIPSEAQAKEKAAIWIRELLSQYQAESDNALGCVKIDVYSDQIHVCLFSQFSLPSLGYASGESKNWYQLWDIPEADEDSYKEQWRTNAYLSVLKNYFYIAVEEVLKTEFLHLVSGQCYVKASDSVIALLLNEGEWNPSRREIQGTIEVPLATKLEDFENWAVYARKCDQDLELKQELYALAKEGYANALQVVRRRFKQDEDDSVAVILHVIEEYSAYFWLDFIDDFAHRQDVQQVCERMYSRLIQSLQQNQDKLLDWATGLVKVAIISAKQNQPELDPLVEKLLLAPNADYRHFDLAIELLRAKKDVRPFASIIHQAIKQMELRDNRLPDLAEQLFRAGVYELPEGLLVQSKPEKHGEQYASIKFGIQFLDEVSEYAQCRIERLFTGQMLLNNFRGELTEGRSIWPESLDLEPWPQSWVYLLKSVLVRMDFKTELSRFVEVLGSRLNHVADRELFTALFKLLSESQEQTQELHLHSMIRIVRALPDAEEWKKLHQLRQALEAGLAWQANAAGNLVVSREITERLLSEGYQSPALFFLEARLAWKDSGDPTAAIHLALPRLKGLHAGEAKARLINLVGCAYDALGQYAEALGQFQLAADMNPETVFYFDNITEVYDKLGDAEKALGAALDARRRGSQSPIVEAIIEKYQQLDTES